MDSHSELRDFSGLCRLFPLPGAVLFPHVILPLHVFEPRYRQMTQDALDGDQLITIVQSRPRDNANPWVEPVPIMDVACVGKILQHEHLSDGRFNLLLLGCKRVRLVRELPSAKLYRLAEASILEDEACADATKGREDLVALFLEILQFRHRLDPELGLLMQSDISTGILSDIVAHALDLPGPVKQTLLEEVRIDRRMSLLTSILRTLVDQIPRPRPFPQPFSLN